MNFGNYFVWISRSISWVLSQLYVLVVSLGSAVLGAAQFFWRVITNTPSFISGWWRDLALAATGASDEKLTEVGLPEERNRFLFLGSIVIITATWATIGAGFFFAEMFSPRFPDPDLRSSIQADSDNHWSWYHYVLAFLVPCFAFLWGLMIFNIDRVFLSSMLGQTGWKRLAGGCVRLFLAAVLGYVISHPLKILFFSDTIAQYDAEIFLEKRDEIRARFDEDLRAATEEQRRIASELDAIDPTDIRQRIEVARRQKELAEDLKARETSADSRETIQAKYPNGTIPGLRPPVDGIAPEFEAPLIGGVLCASDIKRVEFDENFNKPNAEIEIDDNWVLDFTAAYREYVRDGERPRGGDNEVLLSNCTLGEVYSKLWSVRLDKLLEQQRKIERGAEALPTLQAMFKNASALVDDAQRDRDAADVLARRIVGNGYAYETTLMAELSNPNGIPQEVIDDPERSQLSFYDPSQRLVNKYIGWAIAAVFIFVEMAPVLIKLLMSPGPYERSIADRHAERSSETAEERRQKRKYEVEEEEVMLAHNNTVKSQALAFKVGAERELTERISGYFQSLECENDLQKRLDESAETLGRIRRLSAEMYLSACDTQAYSIPENDKNFNREQEHGGNSFGDDEKENKLT